jgi:hypothetical protein
MRVFLILIVQLDLTDVTFFMKWHCFTKLIKEVIEFLYIPKYVVTVVPSSVSHQLEWAMLDLSRSWYEMQVYIFCSCRVLWSGPLSDWFYLWDCLNNVVWECPVELCFQICRCIPHLLVCVWAGTHVHASGVLNTAPHILTESCSVNLATHIAPWKSGIL